MSNVNLAGPQQGREQAPQQGPWQETDRTSACHEPRQGQCQDHRWSWRIFSWPHEVCTPPPGPITLPNSCCRIHLYQRICLEICAAKFMQPMSLHSCRSIHAKFNVYHDSVTLSGATSWAGTDSRSNAHPNTGGPSYCPAASGSRLARARDGRLSLTGRSCPRY